MLGGGSLTAIETELLVRVALKQVSFGSVCTLLITDTGIDVAEESCKPALKTGITGAGWTDVGDVILDKLTTWHFCGGSWVVSRGHTRTGSAGLGMSNQEFSLGLPVQRNDVCSDADGELGFIWVVVWSGVVPSCSQRLAAILYWWRRDLVIPGSYL